MNEAEFREYTTSIVTLFGGLFFLQPEVHAGIKVIIALAIVLANLWFFTLILHLFLRENRFMVL
jgi:hypothetical protein